MALHQKDNDKSNEVENNLIKKRFQASGRNGVGSSMLKKKMANISEAMRKHKKKNKK